MLKYISIVFKITKKILPFFPATILQTVVELYKKQETKKSMHTFQFHMKEQILDNCWHFAKLFILSLHT